MVVIAQSDSRTRGTFGRVPAVFPPPESYRPTLVGSRYVVSAGHSLAALAAARVFEAGGNAIDAGVAAGLVSNVVQADMCNFGGVAPLLVRPAGSDEVWSISGLGTWGSEVSLERFRDRYGDEMPPGAAVAVVPAAPDAWLTALSRFGTWSFGRVAEAAIEIAEDGFLLDLRTAQGLELMGANFSRWESSARVFWPEGRPPKPGERLRQPALAGLLRSLTEAESGTNRESAIESARRSFYEGEVAETIVAYTRENGGWLTISDLSGFRSEVEPAVCRAYDGWRVHTTGPWSQGPALLQVLAILGHFDLAELGHNSADYLHVFLEAVKLAFTDRETYYGDPRFVDVDLERLLSLEHAAALSARIRRDQVIDQGASTADGPRRLDTTYLCTIDAEGNAFSATPSDTLDGGPIIPTLGIIVSPRGLQSRLDPSHPSVLAPGKRPRLTPAPALALSGHGATARAWAFGSPGGDIIPQAMLQAFLNRVHFGMTPQQAVEAPRAMTFSFPDSFYPHSFGRGRVSVEGRVPSEVRADLARRGHDVTVWPSFEFDAGAVSCVLDLETPSDDGRHLAASADPRRNCYAIGR